MVGVWVLGVAVGGHEGVGVLCDNTLSTVLRCGGLSPHSMRPKH